MRPIFILFLFFLVLNSCGTKESQTAQDSLTNILAKDTLPKGFYRDWLKIPKDQRQEVYGKLRERVEQKRQYFLKRWNAATTESQQQLVLRDSRAYLLHAMADSLLVCWFDTPWDFNGTTQKPGQGTIACGYFVTTTLQHTGFDVQRVWLAQQASSVLIRTLCINIKIKTITNNQTAKLIDYLQKQDDGLFIIGLDTHTGYVVKQGNRIDMLHACYWPQKYVLRESLATSPIIKESKFYMVGNVLETDETLIAWMKQTPIRTP
jgi:hypothetical protein